jgi:CheY-like chemotaxis protein
MAPDRQKTILFAEDEESFRSPVVALLQKSGYNTIVAVDGLDALAKAKQHKEEIHLLLSDIAMPGMTGIELAKQLLIERPGTGVLLISGSDAGMLVLDKGWQFLPKPIMFQGLKQKIESMLNDGPEPSCDPSGFGSAAK